MSLRCEINLSIFILLIVTGAFLKIGLPALSFSIISLCSLKLHISADISELTSTEFSKYICSGFFWIKIFLTSFCYYEHLLKGKFHRQEDVKK